MRKRIILNKKALYILYYVEKMSTHQIGKMFRCTHGVVISNMKKYSIPRRTMSESMYRVDIDKNTLVQKYIVERNNQSQIAKEMGCKRMTVSRYLKKYGIQKREIHIDKETLYILYCVERMNTTEIAKGFGCDPKTILERLRKYNIEIRTPNERQAGELSVKFGNTGELCVNWRGGLTPKNQLIRNSSKMRAVIKNVKERDNNTCQMCNLKGGKMEVHHDIYPFSTHPEYRFCAWNLKTLCINCHRYSVHGWKKKHYELQGEHVPLQ